MSEFTTWPGPVHAPSAGLLPGFVLIVLLDALLVLVIFLLLRHKRTHPPKV